MQVNFSSTPRIDYGFVLFVGSTGKATTAQGTHSNMNRARASFTNKMLIEWNFYRSLSAMAAEGSTAVAVTTTTKNMKREQQYSLQFARHKSSR